MELIIRIGIDEERISVSELVGFLSAQEGIDYVDVNYVGEETDNMEG